MIYEKIKIKLYVYIITISFSADLRNVIFRIIQIYQTLKNFRQRQRVNIRRNNKHLRFFKKFNLRNGRFDVTAKLRV